MSGAIINHPLRLNFKMAMLQKLKEGKITRSNASVRRASSFRIHSEDMRRIAMVKRWGHTRMKRRTCKCRKGFRTRRKRLTTVQSTALVLSFLMNLLIVEDEQLRKIECAINEKMRWI